MTVMITLAVGFIVAALLIPRLAAESLREGDTGAAPQMGHIHGIGG
ncbi:hypothetical protein [Promicromonospora sp. NPDC023987]